MAHFVSGKIFHNLPLHFAGKTHVEQLEPYTVTFIF